MRPQDDSSPPEPSLLLSGADPTPAVAPATESRADTAKLKELQERTLRNRTRLLDRHHQLPLYGKARDQILGTKARWKAEGCPSDHPLIQMILALRMDEDELTSIKGDLEAKEYVRLKLSIKSKIADLLLALQKENDQVYKEVVQVLEFDQRKQEHTEKMALAGSKASQDGDDAKLIEAARSAGIVIPEG